MIERIRRRLGGDGARTSAWLLAVSLPALAANARADAPGRLTVISTPPGAQVTLDGTVHVEGIAPFVVDRGLTGRYSAGAVVPGYRRWHRQVILTAGAADTLAIRLQPLSRNAAVLRSIAFPGWGQRYLERHREASWIFWSEMAIGSAAVYAESRYRSARDDYDRRRDEYAAAEETDAIRSAYSAMEDQYRVARDRRDRRNALLWTGLAVWGAGVLDAAVNGSPEEPGFAVSPEQSGLSLAASGERGGTLSVAWGVAFR